MYRYAKTMTTTKKVKAAHTTTTAILQWFAVNGMMAKSCKVWSKGLAVVCSPDGFNTFAVRVAVCWPAPRNAHYDSGRAPG